MSRGVARALAQLGRAERYDEADEAAEGETRVEGPLRLVDARGRVLMEFRTTEEGALAIEALTGDLRLRAPAGAVRIEAKRGVTLVSEESVSIEAGRSLELKTRDVATRAGARVRLEHDAVSVATRALSVIAHRAEGALDEASLVVRAMKTTAEKLEQVATVLETRAERIFERSTDSYREARDLAETRAARVKLVASETLAALSRRVLVKAREDMKLKGEKIHLG